ncbi:hypothetical protein LCGC14_1410470 [marine sediment metagenome]|uniref:Uncharacterized protein n=1 Tax=marine sediment metagenome TaxID=412755 RepID=A0A0F9JUH9_9ZZZZ
MQRRDKIKVQELINCFRYKAGKKLISGNRTDLIRQRDRAKVYEECATDLERLLVGDDQPKPTDSN